MKKPDFKRLFTFATLIVSASFAAIAGGVATWLFGCTTHERAENNKDDVHKGMYIDGKTLKKADGTPFVLRGINHAHAWYKDQDIIALDAIEKTGANCVRIVCADGDKWSKDSKESIEKLIDEVHSRGMVVILEVHDATGDNNFEPLDNAASFWVEMSDVLKGTEEYCIVNIANEWGGKWDSKMWSEGYTKVIPRLRTAGIENVIMVDCPGWGQCGRAVRGKGLEVFNSDINRNTMFSVHMYGTSGRYQWLIRYNIKGATDQNLCICVGEFGYVHSDGEVDEDYIMKYCTENNIGYLAWSWKGNSGGVEYLDLSNDWEGNSLSPDWGYKVINGEYGIKNTSVK